MQGHVRGLLQRVETVALLGTLCLAGAVRLWGIRWGLPDATHLFSYHPDEYHSLRAALSLSMGDPNPHFFNYGSLYLYLVALSCLWHDAVAGRSDLLAALVNGVPAHREMAAWVLDARLVTVVCGVATVAVAYAAARRLAGPTAGLAAGLMLALMPLHVLNSHYATVDVPQTLFLAACLWLAAQMTQEPSRRSSLLAGVCAGLAASVKYNGALGLTAPGLALLLGQRTAARERLLMAALMLLGAVAAFCLTSPYVLLSWTEAWRDISFELTHMRAGESPVREAYPNGWLFHAHPALPLLALAFATAPPRHRRALLPWGGFGVLWFGMIGTAGVRYARYGVPLEPLAAALAGVALAWLLTRPRAWRAAGAAAIALWLGIMCWCVVRMDSLLAQPNVRERMLSQVLTRVPAQGTVALLWDPWFNVAPVDYCNGGEVLRRNPLFSRFHNPVRRLVVTGVDATRLQSNRPNAVLVSDFELDPVFVAVSPAHRAVLTLLDSGGAYACAASVQRPRFPGLWLPRWQASDVRYPWPSLTLYVRR